MKNSKTLFTLALIASVLFTNCSTDEGTLTDDETGALPCDNYSKDLLALSTAFDNNPNAVITYNSYLINSLNSSSPNLKGTVNTTTDLSFELPTSTSFYNEASTLHGIFVNRAGKYFALNASSGIGQEFVTPTNISAPVELGTESYVIEVANFGYANQGADDHFKVKTFNINDGSLNAALPVSTANSTFTNNSYFNVESMSSATNDIDKLYFLSGTNLVTLNPLTNTASHLDLYPSFSMTDFVRFYGLEYSESLGLIAIMYISNLNIRKLVQINPSNGSYTDLVVIPSDINPEFYSTTYSECKETYYLTSMINGPAPLKTQYFEFDLANNTVSNTQIFNDYVFGIELID